jgi:hypothetical protein
MKTEEALQYADQWADGHTFHDGSQGWRVVCATLAAEVRRLRSKRDPLTDEQIKRGKAEADPERQDLCGWSFEMGVAFAEKSHGITG